MAITWRGGDPSEAQRSAGEVPEGEDVGQAEVVVVGLRMEVEEIADIDICSAEPVGLLSDVTSVSRTRRVIVNLEAEA